MDVRAAACIFITAASVGAASAHHGWGSYDATKVFTITAPVETLTWADPHTHITVKYQGDTWEATLAPLFRMQAREVLTTAQQLGDGLHEFYFHPRAIENDADTRCLLELKTCGF